MFYFDTRRKPSVPNQAMIVALPIFFIPTNNKNREHFCNIKSSIVLLLVCLLTRFNESSKVDNNFLLQAFLVLFLSRDLPKSVPLDVTLALLMEN